MYGLCSVANFYNIKCVGYGSYVRPASYGRVTVRVSGGGAGGAVGGVIGLCVLCCVVGICVAWCKSSDN